MKIEYLSEELHTEWPHQDSYIQDDICQFIYKCKHLPHLLVPTKAKNMEALLKLFDIWLLTGWTRTQMESEHNRVFYFITRKGMMRFNSHL